MQVGTDTYVTIEEADSYIAAHYRRNAAERKRWEELAGEDREILLVNACAEMELLPYRGRKAVPGQALAFPRLPMQYLQATGAPDKVRAAQAELAVWLSDDTARRGDSQRAELQAQGVTGFSLGDLSETFEDGGAASQGKPALLCKKCRQLLSTYLSGGYPTC